MFTKPEFWLHQHSRRASTLLAAVALLLTSISSLGDLAAAESAVQGSENLWAVLIGAERYHHANHLKYTVNDVRRVSDTLQQRGGLAPDHALIMTDDEPNPRFRPIRTSVLKELPAWLEKVAPGDDLLVLFTGHGFRDDDGDCTSHRSTVTRTMLRRQAFLFPGSANKLPAAGQS